jgi:MFS family permease
MLVTGRPGRRLRREGMQVTDSPRRRRPGGLLWHRDFRLLWGGETVSWLGNYMAIVAVPLLAVNVLHASSFAVGALVAAGYLPWLVIGLPAGAWVDQLPVRRVMVTCDLIAAVLYASIPLSAWAGGLTLGQVMIVALLAGTANVFFSTAYQVYVIIGSFRQAYSPPGMLGRVSATMRFLTMGTAPLGALAGGALAAAISPRGALWVLFATIAAAGLLPLSRSFTRRLDLPAAAAPADEPDPSGVVSA